jgi:hypothetical protein
MTDFAAILAAHRRIAIAGGPRTGKTTLSASVSDRPVIATDSYMGLPWGDIPHKVIADIGEAEAFVLEGVQVARTLRKGLAVDAVVYLTRPKMEVKREHVAMAKGIATVMRDWLSGVPGVPVFVETADGLVPAGGQ